MNRRELLIAAPLLGVAKKQAQEEPDVSPAEDLMREHGLLNRVLLVYEECARHTPPPPELKHAAQIIKDFIESYHEKLEEQFLFPRFEKANKLADLTATLRKQHAAGRDITAQLLNGTGDAPQLIARFVRMYRPHEAREDTVLFPAFRALVSGKEYDELGDRFEDREHQLFGKEGFEGKVGEVAKIEQQLGIYDLAQFTP